MRIETRFRLCIYVDDVRHEIISPPGKVNVLIVVAIKKDRMGSYEQFVRINDRSDEWRPVSYSL